MASFRTNPLNIRVKIARADIIKINLVKLAGHMGMLCGLIGLGVFHISLALHVQHMPYRNEVVNRAEMGALVITSAALYLGLFLFGMEGIEEDLGQQVISSVLSVLITLAAVAYLLYLLLVTLRNRRKVILRCMPCCESFLDVVEERSRSLTVDSRSQRPSTNPLRGGARAASPGFDVFESGHNDVSSEANVFYGHTSAKPTRLPDTKGEKRGSGKQLGAKKVEEVEMVSLDVTGSEEQSQRARNRRFSV